MLPGGTETLFSNSDVGMWTIYKLLLLHQYIHIHSELYWTILIHRVVRCKLLLWMRPLLLIRASGQMTLLGTVGVGILDSRYILGEYHTIPNIIRNEEWWNFSQTTNPQKSSTPYVSKYKGWIDVNSSNIFWDFSAIGWRIILLSCNGNIYSGIFLHVAKISIRF